MKCPCCKVDMVKRQGKFGEFFYCNQHGTMSVQGTKIVTTGEINRKLKSFTRKLKLCDVGSGFKDDLNLFQQMEQQMLSFGVRLSEIDRFIEGETLELMQLNAQDDEDHWLNTRPY